MITTFTQKDLDTINCLILKGTLSTSELLLLDKIYEYLKQSTL